MNSSPSVWGSKPSSLMAFGSPALARASNLDLLARSSSPRGPPNAADARNTPSASVAA
uniref:Uncharacterized protein n=1 Tax=uncultured marine virus TaxID=186617 RepID=A0A0F7L8Q0_9VIRU|nr:hypothetical protein [uncultured marine virus]